MKKLVTIQELLERDGHWLGGQRPRYMTATEVLRRNREKPIPYNVFDWAKVSKKQRTKDAHELQHMMNAPNQLLADAPWLQPLNMDTPDRFVGLTERFNTRRKKG
jgi:hypothetical protein